MVASSFVETSTKRALFRLPWTTEKSELTLKVELNVDDARTKIPALVLVGVRVLASKPVVMCQAPGEPAPVQADPVTDSKPAEEACTQEVAEEERLSKVTAPEANRVPINRVLPTTPRVVEGTLVPIPTFPETPCTNKLKILLPLVRESVEVPTLKYPATEVVASSAVADVSTRSALV